MVRQGIVLGHIVSSKGMEVYKSKIYLIANLPIPKTVRNVRSFLDMLVSIEGSLRTSVLYIDPYATFY